MSEVSLGEWNDYLREFPQSHLLQTGEWGELKSEFGWDAVRVCSGGAGAQVLFRKLPLGISFGYIPKGPVGQNRGAELAGLWEDIDAAARRRRAVFLKAEADAWEDGADVAPTAPAPARPEWNGWRASTHSIQPRRTVVVDLRGSESEILGRMKPKCRYNIGLADRKGVTVRTWDDLGSFHRMMLTTSKRDRFAVHSLEYMSRAYELFHAGGMVELLVAEKDGAPLAALMAFRRGHRAWYLYGASTEERRELMPNYLLQWEAMRWAKAAGVDEYDLWGVPDEDEETLEAGFERRQGGLWGVYRFKRGFGGRVLRAAQARDRVYHELPYVLYQRIAAGRTAA